MKCDPMLASAYRDGELSSTERNAFEIHLGECIRCRSALADYARIGRMVAAIPVVTPPVDLRRAVLNRAAARTRNRQPWYVPLLTGVTAAVVLVVGVSTATQYLNRSGPTMMMESARSAAPAPAIGVGGGAGGGVQPPVAPGSPSPSPTLDTRQGFAAATPTAAPACPPAVGNIATVRSDLLSRLGCANSPALQVEVAEAVYQRGSLFRRADTGWTVMIVNGRWSVLSERLAADASASPFQRAFVEQPVLPTLLGDAVDPVKQYPAVIQSFANGIAIATESGWIVFLDGGVFERQG